MKQEFIQLLLLLLLRWLDSKLFDCRGKKRCVRDGKLKALLKQGWPNESITSIEYPS